MKIEYYVEFERDQVIQVLFLLTYCLASVFSTSVTTDEAINRMLELRRCQVPL